MSKELHIAMLENRIHLLSNRANKDNYNIIKSLQREIRKLQR